MLVKHNLFYRHQRRIVFSLGIQTLLYFSILQVWCLRPLLSDSNIVHDIYARYSLSNFSFHLDVATSRITSDVVKPFLQLVEVDSL